jgi:hypothetical protein
MAISDREHRIQQALSKHQRGRALANVAVDYDIPERTLRNRLYGTLPPGMSKIGSQRLSPEQESWLADWILYMEACGRALTHT